MLLTNPLLTACALVTVSHGPVVLLHGGASASVKLATFRHAAAPTSHVQGSKVPTLQYVAQTRSTLNELFQLSGLQ